MQQSTIIEFSSILSNTHDAPVWKPNYSAMTKYLVESWIFTFLSLTFISTFKEVL